MTVDTWVIDASVALKWFLDEDRTMAARGVLASENLFAPSLISLEVYHGLWFASRAKRVDAQVIVPAVQRLPRIFSEIFPFERLFDDASRIARDQGHPIYDCIYLALARLKSIALLTADERQWTIARRCGVVCQVL